MCLYRLIFTSSSFGSKQHERETILVCYFLLFSFLFFDWLPPPPLFFLFLIVSFLAYDVVPLVRRPSVKEERNVQNNQQSNIHLSFIILLSYLILSYLIFTIYIYEGFWKIIQNKRMFFFPCADVCLLSCVHMGKCTDSQIDE